MPPKGKKGKEKGKGDKASNPVLNESPELNDEALREKLSFVSAELDHEREERNYFQLERDKVNTFWEITKKVSCFALATLGFSCGESTSPHNLPFPAIIGAGGPEGRTPEQGQRDGRA